VLYKKAYGFRALKPSKERNAENTIYDLASLTKVVATTTSIMILLSRKEISLWNDVLDYVENFKKGVKIFHLLTYTSCLPPYSDVWKYSKFREGIFKSVLEERPGCEPGSKIIYSCLNFIVLMIFVERVSGRSFKDFCEENIFKPLS